jgi:hypothetical protein
LNFFKHIWLYNYLGETVYAYTVSHITPGPPSIQSLHIQRKREEDEEDNKKKEEKEKENEVVENPEE